MKHGISVAMIVENEAKFIEKALQSVDAMADEICVLLDCHSDDGTREILQQNPKVKIFPNFYDRKVQRFDFSRARNEILKKVQYEWVFILDGDEYLKTPAAKVREVLMGAENDLVFLCVVNNEMGSEFTQHRVFPARKGVYYEGEYHNQIKISNSKLRLAGSNIVIAHSGAHDPDKHKRRIERSRAALAEVVFKLEGGKGVSINDYYNAMKLALVVEDPETAFKWGTQGLAVFYSLPDKEQQVAHRFLLVYVKAKMRLGVWEGIWPSLVHHSMLVGEQIDCLFLSFAYHYRQGLFISAYLYGLKYLELFASERMMPSRFDSTSMYEGFVRKTLQEIQYFIDTRLDI